MKLPRHGFPKECNIIQLYLYIYIFKCIPTNDVDIYDLIMAVVLLHEIIIKNDICRYCLQNMLNGTTI